MQSRHTFVSSWQLDLYILKYLSAKKQREHNLHVIYEDWVIECSFITEFQF